jgi:hypothetical protein
MNLILPREEEEISVTPVLRQTGQTDSIFIIVSFLLKKD